MKVRSRTWHDRRIVHTRAVRQGGFVSQPG